MELHCQIEVKGIVVDTNEEPLIGVFILLKDTSSGTVTDLEGKFTLNCNESNQFIEVNYTGYITKKIRCNSTEFMKIILEVDSTNMFEVEYFGCITYPSFSYVGLNTGIKNGAYGIQINNTLPFVFEIPLFLQSYIRWRRGDNRTEYLTLEVRKTGLVRINKVIEIGLNLGLNRIKWDDLEFNQVNRQYVIGELFFKRTGLGIGLVRQNNKNEKEIRDGIQFRVYRSIFEEVYLQSGYEILFEKPQYYIELGKLISSLNLKIGLRYERINKYEELELSILYRIDH